jgi:hypothetical protein
MAVAAIAVGKRRQPRGEKWWQWRGRWQLVGAGSGAAVVIAAAEARFLSLSESENMHAFLLGVRFPHTRIGNNLAQLKATLLANVQTFDPNVWRPNRVLSLPHLDLSACAEKNGHFLCVSLYRGDKLLILRLFLSLKFPFTKKNVEEFQHCVSIYVRYIL